MVNALKENWKKVVFWFVIVLISIISSISVSVYNYAKAEEHYTITLQPEAKLSTINVNMSPIGLKLFKKNGMYIDEDKCLCTNATEEINFTAAITDTVYIKLSGDVQNVIIAKDGKIQQIDKNQFTKYVGTFDILKNSINKYTAILFVVFIPIIYFIISYIILFYKKIKEDRIKIYDILICAACIFILYLCNYYLLLIILKKFVLVVPIILLVSVFAFVRKIDNKKFENIYISLALICGITMLFIMPPFNVPDESSHYKRAYKDSLFENVEDDGSYAFPKCINEFSQRFSGNVNKVGNKIYGRNYISEVFKNVDYSITLT